MCAGMRASWLIVIGFAACGFAPKQPRGASVCVDAGVRRTAIAPAVGDLVITEIMAKPKHLSAKLAQWFEVTALTDVDLNGVRIERANAISVEPEVIGDDECIHVAAGDYAVFARSDDVSQNGNLRISGVFSFSLNPDDAPDVQLVYGGEIIDRVTWAASTTGAALQLDPDKTDAVANDDPTTFCDATSVYEQTGGNMGTPGATNVACSRHAQQNACIDGASPRPIVKPRVGQLVITEFLANARGSGSDAMQEWFEVANTGTASFDLNGLTVANATTANTIASQGCVSVAPGHVALLAHSIDPAMNGGLPKVDATFSFPLANRRGVLRVLDGTEILDEIAWTIGARVDGVSRQLQPNYTNVVDNDDETRFCAADSGTGYGSDGNVGTPGAANLCPPAPR